MSKRFYLDKARALSFVDKMAPTEGRAISFYLRQGTPQDKVEGLLGKVLAATDIPPGVAEAAAGSGMGAVLFWSPSQTYLIMPPFPIVEDYITDGYDIGPLRSLLSRDYLIALVLVRLGAYSIGVCRAQSSYIARREQVWCMPATRKGALRRRGLPGTGKNR